MQRKKLLICIFIIAFILLTALLLKNYVFEVVVTHGQSMEPTITQGDHILINRLAYRTMKPQRGDIIAFRVGWRILLKRIIGLPGDIIELKNNSLYCNGKLIKKYQFLPFSNQKRRSLKVWDRHLFVIGDNERHSVDSRDFGTILYDDIIGKAIFIYLPFGRMKNLLQDNYSD